MPDMNALKTFTLIFLGAACVAACNCHPVRSPSPPPTCPADKITFEQNTGCLNDGSVEFCVPANDLDALAAVREIVPDVQCGSMGGRARCDLDTEVLCLIETRGMCTAYHGAMTDDGWQTVCKLAAMPFVREIVPTWYE
jgi:hypothetical protein